MLCFRTVASRKTWETVYCDTYRTCGFLSHGILIGLHVQALVDWCNADVFVYSCRYVWFVCLFACFVCLFACLFVVVVFVVVCNFKYIIFM